MGHGRGSFRGLFVGVNTYLSDGITHLRTARWDAETLHALFSDTFPDEDFTLVVDESATRERLITELGTLSALSAPEDTVIIVFSGHGSTTHDLLTHDADPADLPGTAVPLTVLFEHLHTLAARRVVVVLDCCFSGGAGAKVVASAAVNPGATPELPWSGEAGRLVLTACAADQAAYEDRAGGHGLLTHQLVLAFTGRAEVTARDEVPVGELLEVVRRQVAGRAEVLGLEQIPAVHGTATADMVLPRLLPGPRYAALAGPDDREPVTADVGGLRPYGIPDVVLAGWRRRIGELNSLQREAINRAHVLQGRSVVIVAPTAAGKTMVGEMAAVRAASARGRAVFLVPTRALVNELYSRFEAEYGAAGMTVVRATGELASDIPAIVRGRYSLGVLTYETYAGLVRTHPELLDQIGTLVVDEVQNIADDQRGPTLELLLASVLTMPEPRRPQIVALSTGLGDDHSHLDTWLEATPLRWTERPVPLVEGILRPDGAFRGRTDTGEEVREQLVVRPKYDPGFDATTAVIREATDRGGRVIVFVGTRSAAVSEARRLGEVLGLPPATSQVILPRGDDTRLKAKLVECLGRGVAFHTADLGTRTKKALEDAFRSGGDFKLLVSTATLAQGVNLPADLVVIRDIGNRTPGAARTVAAYKNMAGRAGRAGPGRAVVPGTTAEEADVLDTYVAGTPERAVSALLRHEPDLPTLVLRIVAALHRRNHRVRTGDVHGFLNRGFASHQGRLGGTPVTWNRRSLWDAAEHLAEQGMLGIHDDLLAPTPLGEVVSTGTVSVTSAVRLIRLLRAIGPDDLTDEVLLVLAQCTEELDAIQVEWTVSWRNLVPHFAGRSLPNAVVGAVVNAPNKVDRTARALICLAWTKLISMDQLERLLLSTANRRKPIIPVASVLGRTRDVIDTIVELAGEVHPMARQGDLAQLPLQLDHGVPSAYADLAARAGDALDRWDYQCLWRHELRHPEAIAETDPATLATILGDDLRKARAVLRLVAEMAEAQQVFARLASS